MSAQHMQDWVQRLQVGTLELFDLDAFEKVQVDELLQELAPAYPVRFLARHHGPKQEIGLAQRQSGSKRWPTKHLYQCLLLTTESKLMTGMAVMTNLRLPPSRQKQSKPPNLYSPYLPCPP